MFKEYFTFAFKNFHRQIHYSLVTALACLSLIMINCGRSLGWSASFVLKSELALWILMVIYNSCGAFSLEKKSLFFLHRIIDSTATVYGVKLLISWVSAGESALFLFITKLLTNLVQKQLNGPQISWIMVIHWGYFLLLIPLINGICFSFDLKIRTYWGSLVLSICICSLIYVIMFYQKWWDLLLKPQPQLLDLAVLLGGIVLTLFNALPIMNRQFFQRLNYANYPN